jgi:mRNA interferase RelE/StbE
MRAEFKPSFKRDFQALEPPMRQRVSVFCLEIIPAAKSQKDLFEYGVKKLMGGRGYYRMRIGDYRIGFKVENSTIIFMHVLHRKDIYRHFP